MKSATTKEFTVTLPSDIPLPKFLIGQTVYVIESHDYGVDSGLIVGMEWTSRDVALVETCDTGWWYTIEVDPFKHRFNGHYRFSEDGLTLLNEQEEAV